MALLKVENLSIGYRTAGGMLKAVDGVNLSLEEGRSLGLVGESGCGKTTIGMALMGLLPPNGSITGGRIVLDGVEISALDEEELRKVRWSQVAMIFQAAMNALNPVIRVSAQMTEAIRTHRPDMDEQAIMQRVEGLFNLVGLPLERLHDFPHQYSGGMKQRAIIAMALALNPKLIIADEPTTALDVIVQDQILKETKVLQEQFDIGIIFISHDISIVAEVCHDIGVMYAGQLVEAGPAQEVFFNSKHPYTRALVGSFPTLAGPKSKLTPIPGEPPNLIGAIPGCRFCDRCPKDTASCKLEPPKWQEINERHWVLCDHC
ncbi:MAG: ABC transporter ATP-binding protein [Desulfarculaceae bacterium]|nr:ABC transporter ATP-binding protein [Desulfarculaceae bacterium]MCF8072701.1 ABC transporter ATP-binding protein [Desulfarculaceae bacterium]MCF8102580.1 ABC transporter ATP-binding protein [Desulfarculaceae bacterium]MCF8116489.1 ABC transporter ATP-binding protein [Desulfarculaceae bacterium]